MTLKATGGKNIYGFSIGILMLESGFPRIPGDMGNAHTWNFPVLYKIIRGASPDAVVRKGIRHLLEAFISSARELEKEGVGAITTNCGFLALFHREVAAAVDIPVFTSSLMQVPLVHTMLKPSQKVGIITIHSKSLTRQHLAAVGADQVPQVIVGTECETEFSRVILDDEMVLDVEKAEAELIKTALKLISDNPYVGAIVLECTNMTPYAAAIQKKTGMPVFDIYTLVQWVHEALVRKTFTGFM
jgi:Asp/Glu/hydantoin racemase